LKKTVKCSGESFMQAIKAWWPFLSRSSGNQVVDEEGLPLIAPGGLAGQRPCVLKNGASDGTRTRDLRRDRPAL
tara:strand:+ start:7683 stop:7904 length:222 start_codon:yes stop_codon:yes gene_type:complete